MPTKPTTLVDGMLKTPSEARVEHRRQGGQGRSGVIGTFQDYVQAILKEDAVNLTDVLRDRGTGNLYRKYMDLRLFGPLAADVPFVMVKRDQRG